MGSNVQYGRKSSLAEMDINDLESHDRSGYLECPQGPLTTFSQLPGRPCSPLKGSASVFVQEMLPFHSTRQGPATIPVHPPSNSHTLPSCSGRAQSHFRAGPISSLTAHPSASRQGHYGQTPSRGQTAYLSLAARWLSRLSLMPHGHSIGECRRMLLLRWIVLFVRWPEKEEHRKREGPLMKS